MKPYESIQNRPNSLYFHCVREEIDSNMVVFHYLPGNENTDDILSKNWSHYKVWKVLSPIIFWK